MILPVPFGKFSIFEIDGLVFNGTSTQKGQFVPNCGGRKLAQAVEDSQRETMHKPYVTQYNTVNNENTQLHNCNNQLTNHMTYLLNYYVSAFTTPKPDPTHPTV